jgi:hypothetical protein
MLVDFLVQNDSVSLSKFTRIAHISRLKAEEVLTNLTTLNIINIQVSNAGTSFKLNSEYLKNCQ